MSRQTREAHGGANKQADLSNPTTPYNESLIDAPNQQFAKRATELIYKVMQTYHHL